MLFSIITINYNDAAGLKETMASVLSQSGVDFEYIIIDGGSTDGSVDVIKSFLKNDEYAKKISYWVSEPDKGIYNAMNKGLKHATGDFVAMMNSGDSYLPGILKEVANIAKNNKDSVLYGVVKYFENGKFVGVGGKSAEELPKGMIPHQTCFVPLKYHKQYGDYDESFKIIADYDMFLRLYKNKVPFFFTDMIIANYDCGGISSTSKKIYIEDLRIKKKYDFCVKLTKIQRLKYLYGILFRR